MSKKELGLRWVLVTFAVLVAAVAFPGWGSAQVGDDRGPNVWTENFVLMFEDGWNRETEYQAILGQIGIGTASSHASQRERLLYEVEWVGNGVWLMLTPGEAREAAEVARGRDGVVYAGVGMDVNACGTDPCATGMTGQPFSGPEVTPSYVERVGAETYADYSAFNNVHVAILDTGVDAQHPDLRVVDGFDCTREAMLWQRPIDAWRRDRGGHGTHVSGLATANNDDQGVQGMAPGLPIISISILGDEGSGSYASLLCGADQLARFQQTYPRIVANWSVGGQNEPSECESWDPLHTAFCRLRTMGVVNVVSAGNDGSNSITKSPANYPEAVTVSALADFDGRPGGLAATPAGIPPTYRDDQRALFSNWGGTVDVIAPGVLLLSTLPNSTHGYASGTSMSAPVVTGVLASWWAKNPSAEGWEVVAGNLAWAEAWSNGGEVWTALIGPANEPLIRGGGPGLTEMRELGYVEVVEEVH